MVAARLGFAPIVVSRPVRLVTDATNVQSIIRWLWPGSIRSASRLISAGVNPSG